MIIECDGCGRETAKDKALVEEFGESVLYFCSEACRERGADLDSIEPTGASEHEPPPGHVVTGEE